MADPVSLEHLPPDTHPDKLADVLRRDGGIVVAGLFSADVVERLNADLDPHIATREPGFSAGHDDTFYGTNTKRIQGIPAKCRTFVDQVLLDDTLLAVADRILLPNCGDYWMSQSETIFIGPGNPAQELHRDDLNWNLAARLGIDLQISVLVALGEYTPEVGSTAVVPGSHSWPLDRPIDPCAAEQVEMEPGSALIYLARSSTAGGTTGRPIAGVAPCTSRISSAGSHPRRRSRCRSTATSLEPSPVGLGSCSGSPTSASGPRSVHTRKPRCSCGNSTAATSSRPTERSITADDAPMTIRRQ